MLHGVMVLHMHKYTVAKMVVASIIVSMKHIVLVTEHQAIRDIG